MRTPLYRDVGFVQESRLQTNPIILQQKTKACIYLHVCFKSTCILIHVNSPFTTHWAHKGFTMGVFHAGVEEYMEPICPHLYIGVSK